MSENKKNWVVFTDLDGTLLDAQTYSYLPALEAIQLLKEKHIPLIFCTSKTFSEAHALQQQMGISDPFIVENGSALFFNKQQFTVKQSDWNEAGAFYVKVFGKPRSEIVPFLRELERHLNTRLTGFSQMSLERIQQYTGLKQHNVQLALQREFSEPFVSENGPLNLEQAQTFAGQAGFRIVRGNRFYHLLGLCDKGTAVRYLIDFFTKRLKPAPTTIGLGDSPNDREMLEAVNHRICVRRPDGSYALMVQGRNWYCTQATGPSGWAEAIFKLIH